jgi:hypothetical protein
MLSYQKLDAWKACHALFLAVHEATDAKAEQEPEMVMLLQWSALRSAGKLAFGSGTRNRRMFLHATERACGWLSEVAYQLAVLRVMGLLTEEAHKRLDALRGRAAFYTWQLLEQLLRPEPPNLPRSPLDEIDGSSYE